MRPFTRLLRLISQELSLKLKIFLYSCGCVACAIPWLRVIRDGSANVASDSSVLKEITHVFPPAQETACDRTVTDPAMPANMGNISGIPVKVRLSLTEAFAIAQLGEHQTEYQKVSSIL